MHINNVGLWGFSSKPLAYGYLWGTEEKIKVKKEKLRKSGHIPNLHGTVPVKYFCDIMHIPG